MSARITTVSVSDYEQANESYEGFCARCRAFTTGSCEPDAHGYECEECGAKAVYGAEEALYMGLIDISGDDEDYDRDSDYLD
jgi:hypothetical protein